MKKSKRGRPKTTGKGKLIGLRLHASEIALLDAWIAKQKDHPSRQQAIRRIVQQYARIVALMQPQPERGPS